MSRNGPGQGRGDNNAPPKEDPRGTLASVASAFGRSLGERESTRLMQFFDLLLLWNRRINLTGAQSAAALASEHFPDSLALDALVPVGETLLDVGSGGGLPALPFALLRPDIRLTLLEPRSRRAAFLRTAVRELGIPATIDPRRLEQTHDQFQVLCARAVLPPDQWVHAAAPRVASGGRVIVYLSEAGAWRPPPTFPELGQVAYNVKGKERVALALAVPRGT